MELEASATVLEVRATVLEAELGSQESRLEQGYGVFRGSRV